MRLTNLWLRSRVPRRAAGYALLEALIAVVVTSVGFIGAARLQTLGMSFANTAGLRQKATLLVDQMTDRMRANQAGIALGAYNKPDDSSTVCSKATGCTACRSTVCTPAEMAQADLAEWRTDVAAQLPGGMGVVCIDSKPDDGTPAVPACDGNGRVLAVKVWWTDKLGSSRFTTAARPAP